MKNTFLLIMAVLLLSACSGDDRGTNNSDTIESYISIDGNGFYPIPRWPVTYLEERENGTTMRFFRFVRNELDTFPAAELVIGIMLDNTQESADGTYSFEYPVTAKGTYTVAGDLNTFVGGSVTVDDMGNNRYRIAFNEALAVNITSPTEKTFTGYFEGGFSEQEVN